MFISAVFILKQHRASAFILKQDRAIKISWLHIARKIFLSPKNYILARKIFLSPKKISS